MVNCMQSHQFDVLPTAASDDLVSRPYIVSGLATWDKDQRLRFINR